MLGLFEQVDLINLIIFLSPVYKELKQVGWL